MEAPQLTQANCGGQWVQIVEKDPDSVCAPQSILVCALRTVGVQLHPAFGFRSFTDERGHFWRWIVSPKSKDDLYETLQLVKWWNDPAWLAAHPAHEWAIVRAALHNMSVHASEIRQTIMTFVVKRGKMEAHIPENASPARRQHLLDQLEGKIKVGTPFVEPEPSDSQPSTLNSQPA